MSSYNESIVQALQSISNIEGNISDLKTDFRDIKVDVANLKDDMGKIKTSVATTEVHITNLYGSMRKIDDGFAEYNRKGCSHHGAIVERNASQDKRLNTVEEDLRQLDDKIDDEIKDVEFKIEKIPSSGNGYSKKKMVVIGGSFATIITSIVVGIVEVAKIYFSR